MIIGAHSILYSKKSDLDRAFLQDVLGLPHVDADAAGLFSDCPLRKSRCIPDDNGGTRKFFHRQGHAGIPLPK